MLASLECLWAALLGSFARANLMTQTRGLVTWLNSLHWACHSSFCLCFFGGFLSPPSSSHLLSSHLIFSLIFWRDDGDVCPRWPTHQNTRDLAPYFRQKHHTLCCPKEKMWMRIYPGESALPIAHQKPSPPPAVKEKCQSNEGMRSVEKVIEWWSLQPLCSSHEWKRQSRLSNWPHFGLTPPSDILRGRFRCPDAVPELFM